MGGKLLLALLITAIYYGLFPIIFALARKNPITNKKYHLLCYGINFALMLIIQSSASSSSSPSPFYLWTTVSTAIGAAILRRKGILGSATDSKNTPEEQIDVDRHKDSATLGRDPLTPYCTKQRYQNKDWATIETFLNSTLCGEKGEELLFKYRATTTIGRSATIIELIYIFDSFTKTGEKYSELYVCDECDSETTVPPVGYRHAKELTIREDCKVKTPTFSLSFPDEKPTAHGSYNIRGSDVALEQPNGTSSYCLSSPDDKPFVPSGDSDIFGRDMLKKEPLNKSSQQLNCELHLEKKNEDPPHQSADFPPVEYIPEIRFCRKCGSQLVPNSRFCTQCGTAIIIASGKNSVALENSQHLTSSAQVDVTNHTSNNVRSTHSVVPSEPQVNKETVETTSLRKCIEYALKYTTDDGCYSYMKLRYTSLPTPEKHKIETLLCLPVKQFRLELEKMLSTLD